MSGNHEVFDADQFAAMLSEAVQRVKTEEDPVLLNEYKKLFKKNVPLTLRSWVAAYFAKTAFGADGNRSRRFRQNGRNGRRNEELSAKSSRAAAPARSRSADFSEERPKPRRVQIDEALAATIFISVGRNRRVFPRDLVSLISQVAGIDRERIGDIRVLDNYSFVQLFAEDADKVISVLNGYEYRGRNLAVSYSRKKDELELTEGMSDASSGNTEIAGSHSIEEDQKAFAEEAVAEEVARNDTDDDGSLADNQAV